MIGLFIVVIAFIYTRSPRNAGARMIGSNGPLDTSGTVRNLRWKNKPPTVSPANVNSSSTPRASLGRDLGQSNRKICSDTIDLGQAPIAQNNEYTPMRITDLDLSPFMLC